MNPIVVVLILFGIWLLLPRRTQAPGCLRRTPKWKIVFRMVAIPFLTAVFWSLMFCISSPYLGCWVMIGGLAAIVFSVGWCWGLTNLAAFLHSPRYYRIWKQGGGDPWFDSLDPPLNTDPPSVRYQELYREKARQECEELFGVQPQVPTTCNDGMDLNDPNII
jgi:hypothetical protein